MKTRILVVLFLTLGLQGLAQTAFIKKAKIEFERKTNTHRLYFTGETDSWAEEFKKLIPQFRTEYFDLVFDETKSIYRPGKEVEQKNSGFFESPALQNIVYTDRNAEKVTSQKQVFETMFLVQDSTKKFTWKLEPETRTIAGFECRKAVTRICDSVVVVAFYSEEIIPSVGPESFNGLPGAILGLAVPRLYTTWFATKVEVLNDKDEKTILAPTKGKKAGEKDMVNSVNTAIKNWGDKYRDRSIWAITL